MVLNSQVTAHYWAVTYSELGQANGWLECTHTVCLCSTSMNSGVGALVYMCTKLPLMQVELHAWMLAHSSRCSVPLPPPPSRATKLQRLGKAVLNFTIYCSLTWFVNFSRNLLEKTVVCSLTASKLIKVAWKLQG